MLMIDLIITIILLLISLLMWYIVFGLECWVNGLGLVTPIQSHLLPFYGLCQDVRWLIMPWTKTEHIRKWIDSFEDGYIADWSYKEIREKNLYATVAKKVLPGVWNFVVMHMAIPFGLPVAYLMYRYFVAPS